MSSLILTYHAVEPGPSPLCLDPDVFREHLDCVVASGAKVVGVAELADTLRSGTSTENTVAITFDDGFASVAEVAGELLAERGLTATVFCVAGHVGGRNDWPSARNGGFEARLADGGALRRLVDAGIELGSHGMTHAPLVVDDDSTLEREVVDSRSVLAELLERPVTSFAYPYGAAPSGAARRLVEQTYAAACTTRIAGVTQGADPYALPRVDAHYLRDPALLERALAGSLGPYLRARGIGAKARRVLRADYARVR